MSRREWQRLKQRRFHGQDRPLRHDQASFEIPAAGQQDPKPHWTVDELELIAEAMAKKASARTAVD